MIAEIVNKYFSRIGPILAKTIGVTPNVYTDYLPPSFCNSAVFVHTDSNEILQIIDSLNNTNSTGEDDVPSIILKQWAQYVANLLSKLINNAFESGIFPTALKSGKVVPIYKSGSKNLCENYRPISLISNFAKIFEKAITIRLKKFLQKINIPSKNQFGFQKKSLPPRQY